MCYNSDRIWESEKRKLRVNVDKSKVMRCINSENKGELHVSLSGETGGGGEF